MWDGIKNGFKAVINWIIDKWNGLGFDIPTIDLGPLGKIGGGRIDFPDVPRLHSGGTFNPQGGAQSGLAVLRKGETVTAAGAQGPGGVIVVQLNWPDGSDAGRFTVGASRHYERALS